MSEGTRQICWLEVAAQALWNPHRAIMMNIRVLFLWMPALLWDVRGFLPLRFLPWSGAALVETS